MALGSERDRMDETNYPKALFGAGLLALEGGLVGNGEFLPALFAATCKHTSTIG